MEAITNEAAVLRYVVGLSWTAVALLEWRERALKCLADTSSAQAAELIAEYTELTIKPTVADYTADLQRRWLV